VIATRLSPVLALQFETPRQDCEGMVGEAICLLHVSRKVRLKQVMLQLFQYVRLKSRDVFAAFANRARQFF
jgi:hypothetical protein